MGVAGRADLVDNKLDESSINKIESRRSSSGNIQLHGVNSSNVGEQMGRVCIESQFDVAK